MPALPRSRYRQEALAGEEKLAIGLTLQDRWIVYLHAMRGGARSGLLAPCLARAALLGKVVGEQLMVLLETLFGHYCQQLIHYWG